MGVIERGSENLRIRAGVIGSKMKMPLIFNEHGDVSLYWSPSEAQASIEAIDVKNNEYIAYDATGRRLVIDVKGSRVRGVRLADDRTVHLGELASTLRRYVRAREGSADVDNLPVTQLLDLIQTKRLRN